MAISNPHLTARDLAVLGSLDRHPFTAGQLLRLSKSFERPFTQERLVRRRLQQLREQGIVRSFPFATVGPGGAPHYWKLTPIGFRWLYGEEVSLPGRRLFEAVSPGHHHHTQSLGEFLVHTLTALQQHQIAISHFARENSLKLEAGGCTLYPDCVLQLQLPGGRTFHYCVELDNGTERVASRLDIESIERKLRGYDAHQSQFSATDPHRYLVLFITTRSADRLRHILAQAASVMRNPNRTVFVGATLAEYLSVDPCKQAVLRDHRGLKRALVPVISDERDSLDVNSSQMTTAVL